MIRTAVLSVLVFVGLSASLYAGTPAENLKDKPDRWFSSDEGRFAMECILSWQSMHGDWPKNKDTISSRYSADRLRLTGTFDNGATLGELRALARAYRLTKDDRYRDAVLLGFDHIIAAQYPNGGWPQYFPLSKKYHRHITFNDGTMIRVMEFLRDAIASDDFECLDEDRRTKAAHAITRGIDCILKCQVVVDGKATVWCAQHDEVTLEPANARAYELASLSGSESAGVLKYLMSIEDPGPQIIQCVHDGMAWFKAVRIDGYRYQRSDKEPNLIADPDARPLWARFYEINTNRPFFCDRDGVVKYDVNQLDPERRAGYTWYGNWGESLQNMYAKWPYRKR